MRAPHECLAFVTQGAMVRIIEGPVGAGKTTFAHQRARQYKTPPLVLDDWMVRLFRADRPQDNIWPWYAERPIFLIAFEMGLTLAANVVRAQP
tara:strand:+ start:16780 stop:17058 length:279 start_codon:yes stop_codon:yes gene_type:complete